MGFGGGGGDAGCGRGGTGGADGVLTLSVGLVAGPGAGVFLPWRIAL